MLFSAIRFLSMFGAPLTLLAPAPMVVLCIRHGERLFLLASGAAMVIASVLLGGGVSGAAYLLTCAIPALLISRGLAYGWRPEKIVGISAVIIAGGTLLAIKILVPDGVGPEIEQLVTSSIAGYQKGGAPPEIVAMLQEQAAGYTRFLVNIMPMAFMWSGMALTLASMLVARRFFTRHPHPAVHLESLTRWQLPDSWVWGLIAAGVIAALPIDGVRMVAGNVLGVLAFAYACQGWAVMAFIFLTRKVHPGIQAAVYLTLLFWPILVLVWVAVGVFDVWTDSRKLRVENADDNTETPPSDDNNPTA